MERISLPQRVAEIWMFPDAYEFQPPRWGGVRQLWTGLWGSDGNPLAPTFAGVFRFDRKPIH
jgi:hypothetical protein